jgi:hypothetical protein
MILGLMKQQNSAIKYLFNRIQDSPEPLTQRELTSLTHKINNTELIDSWFKQSAVYKALSVNASHRTKIKEILEYNDENPGEKKKLPSVIFGGKDLFFKRLKRKIKKSEFALEKLMPLCSIGESLQSGNRKFRFKVIEDNSVIFQPNKETKIKLILPHLRKNYSKIIPRLQELTENKKIPIQFEIDLKFIYITYDENLIKRSVYKPILSRYMAIDLNPNYVGYSIIDWRSETEKEIIKTGIISIKQINDSQKSVYRSSDNSENLYWNNKREHEVFQISKELVNIALTHQVERFGLEDLSMKSCDKSRGKNYNRLVNNFWSQEKFSANLIKRLNIIGIKSLKVTANYSSFVGNMLNQDYPDPVASSIEINRRLYKYYHRINFKDPVIFPSFKGCKSALIKSLEEIDKRLTKLFQDSKDWKDFYYRVKNSGLRYRVPLDRFRYKVFRLFHGKSFISQFIDFSMI